MNKKNLKTLSSNMLSIWEGKISLPNNNLGKGAILPVRLSEKGKAIIFDQNAETLWTPSDDLSQVIANFIQKDIFISAIITARPDKKNKTAKIKIFAFYE